MSHRGRPRERRTALSLPLLLLLLVALPADTGAQGERLVVAVTAVSGPAGGILAAQESGLFRDEGLDVELNFLSTSALSLPALLSGQVQVVTGAAGPPVIGAILAGGDLVWVAELLGTMPYSLVATPAVASPAELRGKRIGVSRFGTSSDFVARFFLRRAGLDPARDATVLQIGSSSVRVAAVAAGSIDATVLPPEALPTVTRLGLRSLADTHQLGLRYPQEGIVTTRAFVQSRPDTLRRFLRAVIAGTHRFRSSRGEGLALLRKHLKFGDDESVAATYDAYAPLTLAKPYLDPASVQFVLDELARTDPRARAIRPERLMDMGFVQELDRSGFIDRLYGR